ncbi:MAG: hypothetical protein AB7N91_24105 [Candidatus Tectimicrobiota bacterium]
MPDATAAEPAPASRSAAARGTCHCPTCRTAWRGEALCPRCGTELTALMQVAVQAWSLRQAARAALCEGNRPAEALALAQAACRLQNTPCGQRLLALALLALGESAAASALLATLLPGSEASPA